MQRLKTKNEQNVKNAAVSIKGLCLPSEFNTTDKIDEIVKNECVDELSFNKKTCDFSNLFI